MNEATEIYIIFAVFRTKRKLFIMSNCSQQSHRLFTLKSPQELVGRGGGVLKIRIQQEKK